MTEDPITYTYDFVPPKRHIKRRVHDRLIEIKPRLRLWDDDLHKEYMMKRQMRLRRQLAHVDYIHTWAKENVLTRPVGNVSSQEIETFLGSLDDQEKKLITGQA